MKFTYQDLQKLIHRNYFTAICSTLASNLLLVFILSFIFPSVDKLYLMMTIAGVMMGVIQQFMHNTKRKNQQSKEIL